MIGIHRFCICAWYDICF